MKAVNRPNGWSRPGRTRTGFTLVELLTVIVILGILTGLISAAVVAAIARAREARVTLEIRTMEAQLQVFKNTYGDFPPSNLQDAASVGAFLRRAFPRYPANGADPYTQFKSDLSANDTPLTVTNMDAAAALVFWLGGMPDSNGKLCGFAKDPENPFCKPSVCSLRNAPLFDFVRDRLVISGATMRYYPDMSGAREADAPYVYFRAVEYTTAQFTHSAGGENVVLKPYQNNRTGTAEWVNPQTLQIISAGRDNLYGGTVNNDPPRFPTTNFDTSRPGHHDNLTNFLDGKLEDALQ